VGIAERAGLFHLSLDVLGVSGEPRLQDNSTARLVYVRGTARIIVSKVEKIGGSRRTMGSRKDETKWSLRKDRRDREAADDIEACSDVIRYM
jgi:hypothetical protein